jgi:hypothetical protein
MCDEIIQVITLLANGITKKNTTTCTNIKLIEGCEVGNITKISKNT